MGTKLREQNPITHIQKKFIPYKMWNSKTLIQKI